MFVVLDSRVGCILGYNSLDGRLFAVSASADTYMSSLDGSQWFSITLDDMTKTVGSSLFHYTCLEFH